MKSNPTRRHFLKEAGLALAAASLMPKMTLAGGLGLAPDTLLVLGIQLYTVRDDMKSNPQETLHQLAAMGYQHVEHAGYGNRTFYGRYDAVTFKKLLNDLGIDMPSGHTVLHAKYWDTAKNDFTDEWKYTIEDAATVGQQYVISPGLDEAMRRDSDSLKRFLDVFNKCGELCKSHGMKFGYHNHDFEFKEQVGGKRLFDIILQQTDPGLVVQQLDIGNMYLGGARPLDVLAQYPDRFELMHVKDVITAPDGKGEMGDAYETTVLGTGILGTQKIVQKSKAGGKTTQFIIEQESYQGRRPLEDSLKDLIAMKGWGF